jgi:hypothetical protein
MQESCLYFSSQTYGSNTDPFLSKHKEHETFLVNPGINYQNLCVLYAGAFSPWGCHDDKEHKLPEKVHKCVCPSFAQCLVNGMLK